MSQNVFFQIAAVSLLLLSWGARTGHAQEEGFYAPMRPAVQPMGELEKLAVDIGRRCILAYYPVAGEDPMRTLEVRVRPAGDVVHTYAKIQWSFTDVRGSRFHESEIFSTLVYTPQTRRMIDISYSDNHLEPHRAFNRRINLLSKFNEQFDRRDPLRMPAPEVGNRMDFLAPRRASWVWNYLSGDHAWHVFAADDQVAPRWAPVETPIPTP
ncbi:hypothetical protein GC197_08920 [bacterium]|nr:hypothetical protein [bacterium]